MPRLINPPPRYCALCGQPIRCYKYCYQCREEGKRITKRESSHRYKVKKGLVKRKGFTCDPEKREWGCGFYLVCSLNISRPDWWPYCSPETRLHELFLREYGREAAA